MRKQVLKTGLQLLMCIGLPAMVLAQKPAPTEPPVGQKVIGIPVNYDESKVGTYTLPDPLTLNNGDKVTTAEMWTKKRRPEILKMYEDIQFGKTPGRPKDMSFNVFDKGTPVFDGRVIRKQVTVYFTKDTSDHKMDVLIYLPAKAARPTPLLLMVSFSPNSTVSTEDPGVKQGTMWTKDGKKIPAPKTGLGKLDVEKFTSKGIAVATVYYGDIEPDFKWGYKYGVRGLYLKPGQTYPADNEWGAISAWAWGLSRAMDYFETDKDIDAKHVAITGASRLGKTALWTGAHDTRFAVVIASISGEGGAALSRRDYGETIRLITDTARYFYQFAPNYATYGNRIDQMPMDGHMLISLIAPRPLLLQTGNTDFWSDPKGEFLAAIAAQPVYHLFGEKGPETDVMPKAEDTSLLNPLGYYMHVGPHAVFPSDQDVFVTYMLKYLVPKK